MCGICGQISRERDVQTSRVTSMMDAMAHRGPDGAGRFERPHVAMAMRRLSVIALEDGWQPIYNESGSLAIVANGEIYNYLELRADLQKRGHRFNTHSDIETILHLYEEQGPNCVDALRGMFVFALWDEERRRLMLARDRVGEKPLYLYEIDGRVSFASEMKGLLASGAVPMALDPNAVHDYFHYGYVPEPGTVVRGVRKLPAGHYVTVSLEPWALDERAYWRMEDIPPVDGDPPTLIREQLEEVSALVIRSDVPVGVALSGGVDSSAIAALAVRKFPGSMHAVSLGYAGRPEQDERQMARDLAAHLKMPFSEVEVIPEEQAAMFPQLVSHQDDPIADIAGYGYYAISRKAREIGVPVLLQGQGGDELFWGYEWTRRAIAQTLRKQAHLAGHGSVRDYVQVRPPAGLRPGAVARWGLDGFVLSGWREFERDRTTSPAQMVFMELAPDFPHVQRRIGRYYSRRFREAVRESSPTRFYNRAQPWMDVPVEITRLIANTYLLENGIAQGDRLSMANSVELRLPLVDFRLIETVIGLRRTHSDHTLPPKAWFKEAVKDLLPLSLLARKKRGFQPPVREWHKNVFRSHGHLLKQGQLVHLDVLHHEAAEELAAGPFPIGTIAPISFKALVLELWCRQMVS